MPSGLPRWARLVLLRGAAKSRPPWKGRSELETIIQFLHAGDELVVLRLNGMAAPPATFSISFMSLTKTAHPCAFLSPKSRQPEAWGQWSSPSSPWSLTWNSSSSKTGNERASTRQKLTASIRVGKRMSISRRSASESLLAQRKPPLRELNISRMTVYRALEDQGSQSVSTRLHVRHLFFEGTCSLGALPVRRGAIEPPLRLRCKV